ncbi:MAG: SIMPL domain-containing protein [Candidatus Sulfotelmatobacter sp.]
MAFFVGNAPLLLAYTTHMYATEVWLSGGRQDSLLRFIAILLACAAVMQAQDTTQRRGPASMRVHGQATLSVEPDQVQFDIGVVTQATTPQAAGDQNASQSNALVRELNAAFPSATAKGIDFSINPNYQYPRDGAPTIAGYTASNTVRLLLNDISRLQTVIDIAIKSGATSINRLTFTLHNENSVRARALAAAANQAQAGAEALAISLKLKLDRLLTVEEGQPVVVSAPREISFEKLQSTSLAPISAGTIDVHADVDLTYEIAPAAERPGVKVPSAPQSPVKR